MDLVDGTPTGSIRISFGYMSTTEDVDNLISFVNDCFLETEELVAPVVGDNKSARHSSPEVSVTASLGDETEDSVMSTGVQVTVTMDGSHFSNVTLENIFLYPVKSCACFEVSHSVVLLQLEMRGY